MLDIGPAAADRERAMVKKSMFEETSKVRGRGDVEWVALGGLEIRNHPYLYI